MPVENVHLGLAFAGLLLVFKLGSGTLTPLFLDSLNPSETVLFNASSPFVPLEPSLPSWHRIDPFICIWISMGFDTLLLGSVVLLFRTCKPGSITHRELNFPKRVLFFSGSSQAFSALMYQFSTSGSRTSPYLFGVLGYFFIPITFTLRFLILRKKPTRIKLLCASVIVMAEFISLIPTMFPQLESEAARKQEGGATGVGRILWPMCMVASGIPHAIWSIMLERSVQSHSDDRPIITDVLQSECNDSGESGSSSGPSNTPDDDYNLGTTTTPLRDPHSEMGDGSPHIEVRSPSSGSNMHCDSDTEDDLPDIRTLNMAYIMFWNFFGTFMTTLALFWVDLIPGFGLMPDIKLFGKQFVFNVRCIVGAEEECGSWQIFTAWGRMVFKTSAFVTSGLLLRYGEGANFYAILGAVQQPLKFLTFTLFDEQPFRWRPHATLSTWLSIGALAIMFPAVIVYTRSPEPSTDTPSISSVSGRDKSRVSGHNLCRNGDMNETSPLIQDNDQPEHTEPSRESPVYIGHSINQSGSEEQDSVLRRHNHQGYGSLDSVD